jgi:serine/threonine-protein kinase
MNEPQPPPVRGLVAGKYEIVSLIGRGGMGSVWEGRHASLGTRVAIKFIDQEHVGSREAQARFVTEARAAATIQSRHATQIFDHGVSDDGRPYIVMELLVGEPLDKRIERVGRMSVPETARILRQVSRALQRAHDAGIIHRDLKPENIFLVRSPDDDDEIAKVLDFGIAKIKATPGGAALTSSTKTGAVLGTPYYMSPEQARGLRTIDHRADLWSLGVIAFKCVTGVLPFDGESVGDLLVKICTAPAPTPSVLLPGLPKAFDAWFRRTLEREPANRYASAVELGEALADAAGISARRAPDEPALRGAALHPTVPQQPLMPLPTAAITSSPFTASAVPAGSSRGVAMAVLAAALVGGTVGVLAVVKLKGTRSAPPAAAASVPRSATMIATAPAPAPEPEPASVPAPARATSTAPPAVHMAPKLPLPPSKSVAALPPAALPKPASSASSSADPGY